MRVSPDGGPTLPHGTFWFRLHPGLSGCRPQWRQDRVNLAWHSLPRRTEGHGRAPVTRILVVDDSPTLRRMVRAALQPLAGAEFAEADTGFSAIEGLAFGPVALIVLDLNMPDMHGVEVLKFVRAQPSYRHIPVIVLTTRGDEASRAAALEAGATAYLTKPFGPSTLAAEARKLLDRGAVGAGS